MKEFKVMLKDSWEFPFSYWVMAASSQEAEEIAQDEFDDCEVISVQEMCEVQNDCSRE